MFDFAGIDWSSKPPFDTRIISFPVWVPTFPYGWFEPMLTYWTITW